MSRTERKKLDGERVRKWKVQKVVGTTVTRFDERSNWDQFISCSSFASTLSLSLTMYDKIDKMISFKFKGYVSWYSSLWYGTKWKGKIERKGKNSRENEFWKREQECWKLSIKRRGRKAVQSQRGWDLNLLTVWKRATCLLLCIERKEERERKERGKEERTLRGSCIHYVPRKVKSERREREWNEREVKSEGEREEEDVFYVFIWKKDEQHDVTKGGWRKKEGRREERVKKRICLSI